MEKTKILEIMEKVARENLGDNNLVLREDMSLDRDLDVDSIALMTYVIGLEDEFGITISDDAIDGFKEVRDLQDYIAGQL